MIAPPAFTLLVNTSDGYADCWPPFFSLLARQWSGLTAPIILNTERAAWICPQFDVRCARTAAELPASIRQTWSECLLSALRQVKTPLLLYMQEDYFLHSPVDAAAIDGLASAMQRDDSIQHIGLTHFGALGPFAPSRGHPGLWEISPKSRYRVSTQAALWRTGTLASYLQADENAWMFEIFGTWRAAARRERFLTVDRHQYGPGKRVVDYVHTGIVKGRWHPGIPQVFAANGIKMDFSRRGFYRQPNWLQRKAETAVKLISNPRALTRALLG